MNSNLAEEQVLVSTAILNSENKIRIHKYLIYKIIKRTIDIIGGLVGVMLLVPITVGVAIARLITKENDGPIFYEQLRIGKNGSKFRIFKFRSMVIGADEALAKYLAENEEARKEYKKYKKLKNDPRITKVGKFLRKTSLDEFPQLINVLKGEMSLVGPRPYLPREKEDMGEFYTYIIKTKPGLTGYWQVNGRSDVDFKERLNMDYYYTQHRGIKLDTKLLVKTFMNVIKKEGAI